MSKHNGLGTLIIHHKVYDKEGEVVSTSPKEYPFHVQSTRQTEKFTDTLGIELDEYWVKVGELSNGKALSNTKIAIVFLWSALYAGAMKTSRKCDFTYDDVLDWFEAATGEEETAEMMKPLLLFAEMLTETKKKLDEQPALKTA